MNVCMYVCIYACIHVCMNVWLHVSLCICQHACIMFDVGKLWWGGSKVSALSAGGPGWTPGGVKH